MDNIKDLLRNNNYPGRGIILGNTKDGKHAVAAYFIMGRSENSRNRIFVIEDDGISTKAFDESKVIDPSLIIYHPVREYQDYLIVTNGDQTDTILDGLKHNRSMKESLITREFEPDEPNYTPRISGLLKDDGTYELSILKSIDDKGSECLRFYYEYPSYNGIGHFIHTYQNDGNPLPSYSGEPKQIELENNIDELTETIWQNLNEENKISLYVCYIDKESKEKEIRILNKNIGE